MGISSILGAVLKNVSWEKIARMAMEYGPELYRQAKERFQNETEPAAETAVETELQERIVRLEKLLLEQETVIRDQAAKNIGLQEQCAALERRLFIFKISCGTLLSTALIMLVLLLK